MSVALENSTLEHHKRTALTEVKTEFAKYVSALEQHPRLLVGTQVPAIGKEGFETLRDSADAKEWQDAVSHLLRSEVQTRAEKLSEASQGTLQTLHSSIELFQNNPDLVPGTRQFDRELADQLMRVVKPYEMRVEGKLHGFAIPVQPLVNQLRSQLATQRAAASTPPPAPATPTPPPAPAAKPPQAGIVSKAGQASETESFDALFGTIGLSGIRL